VGLTSFKGGWKAHNNSPTLAGEFGVNASSTRPWVSMVGFERGGIGRPSRLMVSPGAIRSPSSGLSQRLSIHKEFLMPIYLNWDDKEIKGGVTAKGHEEWIAVDSFQWGSSRHIATPTGNTTDRVSSTPSVSEISVHKEVDIASTHLFQEHLAKKPKAKDVTIDFCMADDDLTPYLTYTLKNALISHYSVSSNGHRPHV
jgi:type VI secretion system secreted protein Hcp